MKIKKINVIKLMIGMLFAIILFNSCKKLIEIPQSPPSAVVQQRVFADSATTMTAVAGVYTYSPGMAFAYTDGKLTYLTGLSADELSYVASDDKQQFYNYSLTPLNSYLGELWGFPYQNLYEVNAILAGIKNNAGLSASFQKQITGEMEVMRALIYFNLVNLFGGVPLVTQTDYSLNARLPRATTDEVYAQILSDLNDATKKLNNAYPSAGRLRPNLYTALAFKSKVNLYRQNWQNAFNEADSVINSGIYSVSDVALNGVFLDGSNEAIWQIPANQGGNNGAADALNFIPANNDVSPSHLITKNLLDAFEPGDQRFKNWVGLLVLNGNSLYYPLKYKNVLAATTPTEDQMIIRLGEVYLIRAEAAAHLNNLAQTMADVNIIRQRAGLPASTVNTTLQADVLNAVMHERQIELFCEWGNRWFDLKRTGIAATVLGAEKKGYTPNAAIYPIPQSQILLNNLLKQNPGY